jgi:hypothetical protein
VSLAIVVTTVVDVSPFFVPEDDATLVVVTLAGVPLCATAGWYVIRLETVVPIILVPLLAGVEKISWGILGLYDSGVACGGYGPTW